MNLMTQPGETDGMSGIEHLNALEDHVGGDLVDVVIANRSALPDAGLRHYAEVDAVPVQIDRQLIKNRGIALIEQDLLDQGELIRHDPAKLCRAVVEQLPVRSADFSD
jgi:uncharacterized cofD-like protein